MELKSILEYDVDEIYRQFQIIIIYLKQDNKECITDKVDSVVAIFYVFIRFINFEFNIEAITKKDIEKYLNIFKELNALSEKERTAKVFEYATGIVKEQIKEVKDKSINCSKDMIKWENDMKFKNGINYYKF